MMTRTEFPRVDLPGLADEDAERISFVRTLLGKAEEAERFTRAQQRDMARAMVALGKPVFRKGKPKRRKPTAHVRHMARMRERATYALLRDLHMIGRDAA